MSQQNQKHKNKAKAREDVSISFTKEGWEDWQYWEGADAKMLERIKVLVKECQRTPFVGTGKPEPLMGNLSGFWSRRLDREHRLVYLYEDSTLIIVGCRHHYD